MWRSFTCLFINIAHAFIESNLKTRELFFCHEQTINKNVYKNVICIPVNQSHHKNDTLVSMLLSCFNLCIPFKVQTHNMASFSISILRRDGNVITGKWIHLWVSATDCFLTAGPSGHTERLLHTKSTMTSLTRPTPHAVPHVPQLVSIPHQAVWVRGKVFNLPQIHERSRTRLAVIISSTWTVDWRALFSIKCTGAVEFTALRQHCAVGLNALRIWWTVIQSCSITSALKRIQRPCLLPNILW